MKNLIIICLLVTTAFTSQAQEKKVEDCDCPKPTEKQFTYVCNEIYEKNLAPEESNFGYQYVDELWQISCAKVGVDSPEQAKKKIQCMWNKYKEEFRCYGHSDVTLDNANVLKFSIDTGFSTFVVAAVKKYELDVNFKDPTDDNTILDFVEAQLDHYRNSTFTAKADEYQRIYDLLIKYGAKHAKDL